MGIKFNNNYHEIISLENLLEAWKEFLNGKRHRKDVQEFELNLMANILSLHRDLLQKTYKHSDYEAFNISDPKPRSIHKASVRDRLLHHAIYRVIYPFFDRVFIADSYSCRFGRGTHKALERFQSFAYKASANHTKTVWVLKCDVRKFFASIDQQILIKILSEHISEPDLLALLSEIISSFHSGQKGVGLPLGNLTSQLLVNIYMDRFDKFVKETLRAKYYIRYADDFVILSPDKEWLEQILAQLPRFLWEELRLKLHPNKVSITTVASGIDFLGWVHFPNHRVLRTVTRRRMLRGIERSDGQREVVQSYLGLLRYGNAKRLVDLVLDNAGEQGGKRE